MLSFLPSNSVETIEAESEILRFFSSGSKSVKVVESFTLPMRSVSLQRKSMASARLVLPLLP